MKVAINRCFGGFSLSSEAIVWLIKKGSDVLDSFSPKEYYGGKNRLDWEEDFNRDLSHSWSKDLGEGFHTISMADVVLYNDMIYTYERHKDDTRTHPDLIQCIEELGEKANGRFGELKIIEIPDGVAWEIDEYDGIESIHEIHRTWE